MSSQRIGYCHRCETTNNLYICVKPEPHYGYYGKELLYCDECKLPNGYIRDMQYDFDLHDHIIFGTPKKDWRMFNMICGIHISLICLFCKEDVYYEKNGKNNNKSWVKVGPAKGFLNKEGEYNDYPVCKKCFRERGEKRIQLLDKEKYIETEYLQYIDKKRKDLRNSLGELKGYVYEYIV